MKQNDFHSVLEALEEPVLLIDRASVILRANGAAREILGDAIEGSPLVRVIRHPEALRCLENVLLHHEKTSAEIHLAVPQRTIFRLTALPLQDDGEEAAVAFILNDMSPLLEAAQMRSDFVANVSHELRSPLTTLAGLIETLQGAAKDDETARLRFLGIMQNEAGRMDRLIDDLLSLSRVEAEAKIRPTESVDLIPVIKAVIATLEEREDGFDHAYFFSADMRAASVSGETDQLTQVFQNLLENAAKYSDPKGAIRVTLEVREKALGFNTPVLIVTVDDEGEGIAAEHVPRLTERFYRVDSGRSRAMGGTGLGLAIVKHIVSRHRGRISITSQQGEGTKVTILLPALSVA